MKQVKFLRLILLFFAFLVTGSIFAQQTVTGTVTDSGGNALPGVTVTVKDTNKAEMTDMNGKFKISVPEGSNFLSFSYIGMETQEIEITGGTINCVMKEMESELDEIVVIGYGQVKKSDATGSVAAISSEDFNKGAITSPQDLLIGKTAGVQITTGGGAPGEGATIRIRGGSSLSASNDPLIVIDGMPVDNTGVSGMRNPLNTINPNDIETFTVLKDASATAIYGSRASNGVIIITTKKGKLNTPFKVSYSGVYSYYTIPKKIDVLTGDEFRELINTEYANNPNALDLLGTANTDWQSEILNNATGHDHNVSFTGATKMMPYRASVGYASQDGILKTDALDRATLSVGLNPSLLDNHLRVNFNVKGMFIKNRFADRGALGSALEFDPTQEVMSGNESVYGGYYTWLQDNGDYIPIATRNPVAQLELREDLSSVNRVLGNLQFDYKMHFLPDLKANLNIAYDMSNSKGTVDVPDYASWEVNSFGNGSHTDYTQGKQNLLTDLYLNYVKEVGPHKFDLMAGYSFQHFKFDNWSVTFNAAQTDTISPENSSPSEYYLESFFGRFNYSLLGRYLLTFTLREDITSRFSPENRAGIFPSAAFAWRISEESFLKNVKAISNLKFRAGYGVTGQQDVGSNYYPFLANYLYSEPNAQYQFGNEFVTTIRPGGYNADLVWEETTTLNFGIDFGFAKDRINGIVEYYQRETENLINYISVPAGTNFTNELWQNVGTMESNGYEFTLNLRPISKANMFWEVGFNLTLTENLITKLTTTEDSTYIGVETGGISGGVGKTIQIHSVGYPANSFYVFEQVYDADGNPIEGLYVDRNRDGVITDDDRYHYHSPAPKYFAGFSSKFTYKGFDFSFAGRFSIGNYAYNNVKSTRAILGTSYNSVGYLTNVTSDATTLGFDNVHHKSDYYIEEASFLRFDNVTLGYSFDKMFGTKLRARIYATAQNIYVKTNYTGLDPEIFSGIDNNIYPRPRTYLLGLNIDF